MTVNQNKRDSKAQYKSSNKDSDSSSSTNEGNPEVIQNKKYTDSKQKSKSNS